MLPVVPKLKDEKSFRFEMVGKLVAQVFERFDQRIAPRVFALSGARLSGGDVSGAYANPVANFFVAGNVADRGGVRVASKDADGDSRADLAVGSGEGSAANVRVYLGKNFTGAGEPSVFQDIAVFGGAVLPGGVFVG